MVDSKITILRATCSDLGLATQAIAEVNLPTSLQRLPLDEVALAEFLADPRHYLLLAIEEQKVVGSLYGYALRQPYRRESQFFVYAIDVRPVYRNRGIGTALVDRFIAEARQAGAGEIWLLTNETNRSAMAMYAHSGLVRSGTGDVVLSLVLNSTRTDSN
jgi:ribosomal protein S18 acetylase RimI-like enzyme